MANTEDDLASRKKDLDETRRLLYMALYAGRTKRYNLAGTLINALRHHQDVADPGLENEILTLVEAGDIPDETWARAEIERIGRDLEADNA